MTSVTALQKDAALRLQDRRHAWDWAARLHRQSLSVWRLEALKVLLERAEAEPGTMPVPGVAPPAPMRARLTFVLGSLAGLLLLVLWILPRRGRTTLPPRARRVAALHGESSTRTRHVLAALGRAEPPADAIILLGRLRRRPAAVAALWEAEGYAGLPPLVVPASYGAALKALADLPALWKEGWQVAGEDPAPLPLNAWIAIAFRVWHGAISARWWAEQAFAAGCEVIFGITGTADTTLLELAIRQCGGRTVHAVHGRTTGPNLLGISDLALFRTAHDADLYRRVGGYLACTTQPSSAAPLRRGPRGLLLLSNLAHPMNQDFHRFGPRDELRVLKAVAAAARVLGPTTLPLWWKPHPVINRLVPDVAAQLRAAARAAGFSELLPEISTEVHAASLRWVVSTPSTVAIDLLQKGLLCLLVDPRGTLLDTATALLPTAPCEPEMLAHALAALDPADAHVARFTAAWQAVRPARALDLFTPLV